MANGLNWKERLVLDKKGVFNAGERFRGTLAGDRTLINLDAWSNEYKLGQAYANIRNLEFRSEKAVKLQDFKDYLKLRGDLIRLAFRAEQKPRPDYSDDESYRNKNSKLHYPNGEMLILVDSAVYADTSASIDQYVLDKCVHGRHGRTSNSRFETASQILWRVALATGIRRRSF